MKKIERRINAGANVKLQKRADGDSQNIAGVAAVVYDGSPDTEYELWDFGSERAVERILPGAFNLAMTRPDDVRGLFNHDANQVLGRTASGTMKLSVDGAGLNYEIEPGNTSTSTDVQEHLSRGDVSGSSIAFVVDEERWTESKDADGKWNVLREILSVTLYDCGPVTFPAYEATSAGMRGAGEVDEAKASLEKHRKEKRDLIPVDDVTSMTTRALKGKLAGYAARARAALVVAGFVSRNEFLALESRDDMHPSTKQAIINAATTFTEASAALAAKLVGLSEPDADIVSALTAVDVACDQVDALIDPLIGEDGDDQAAA